MESLEGQSKPKGLPIQPPASITIGSTLLRVRVREGEAVLMQKLGPELAQGADDAADLAARGGREAKAKYLLAEAARSMFTTLFATPAQSDAKALGKWAIRADEYDVVCQLAVARSNFGLQPARPAERDATNQPLRLGPQQLDVAPRLEAAFRRYVDDTVTPFVLKEVWGFRGDVAAERHRAQVEELEGQVWLRVADKGEDKRRELEESIREHKALFLRAMGVACEGALGVASIQRSCLKQRPALASALDGIGASRAAQALSMADADRAVFDTLVDMVLATEKSSSKPSSATAKEQTRAQKKRLKLERRAAAERQTAKPVQGPTPEATEEVAAAAAARGGGGRSNRRQERFAPCFTCGEEGHRSYEKDKCSGCGYCGEAHMMSTCPKAKEVRAMAQGKFRLAKQKGPADAETSDE